MKTAISLIFTTIIILLVAPILGRLGYWSWQYPGWATLLLGVIGWSILFLRIHPLKLRLPTQAQLFGRDRPIEWLKERVIPYLKARASAILVTFVICTLLFWGVREGVKADQRNAQRAAAAPVQPQDQLTLLAVYQPVALDKVEFRTDGTMLLTCGQTIWIVEMQRSVTIGGLVTSTQWKNSRDGSVRWAVQSAGWPNPVFCK